MEPVYSSIVVQVIVFLDKMMRKILLFFGVVFLLGCKTTLEPVKEIVIVGIETDSVNYFEQLELSKGKTAVVYGKIIRTDFINKAGKTTGVKETLLELSDGATVNIRNTGDKKYNYDYYENKSVKMTGVVFYGNIDSDNPDHQSRVGYRIDYTSIEELP